MNSTKKITFVVALLLLAGFGFADTYVIDPVHSRVGFTVKHLVIAKVHGKFNEFSGTIEFDPKDPAKSTVTGAIKTASIDTDNDQRDEHLRSADFFDAEKNPEIAFKSKKIEKKGEGYLIHGTLTIKGVSKDVVMPFSFVGPSNGRIGIEASLKINRQDFGVKWNKPLEGGGVTVSDDVEIQIDAEAKKK